MSFTYGSNNLEFLALAKLRLGDSLLNAGESPVIEFLSIVSDTNSNKKQEEDIPGHW